MISGHGPDNQGIYAIQNKEIQQAYDLKWAKSNGKKIQKSKKIKIETKIKKIYKT